MTAAGHDWMTTVLRSSEAETPGWQLLAGWTDDGHLMNTLHFAGEQPHLAGGFDGPTLWDGRILNYWYGTGPDDSGLYAVVRTLPRITSAWASLGQTTHRYHSATRTRTSACDSAPADSPPAARPASCDRPLTQPETRDRAERDIPYRLRFVLWPPGWTPSSKRQITIDPIRMMGR